MTDLTDIELNQALAYHEDTGVRGFLVDALEAEYARRQAGAPVEDAHMFTADDYDSPVAWERIE